MTGKAETNTGLDSNDEHGSEAVRELIAVCKLLKKTKKLARCSKSSRGALCSMPIRRYFRVLSPNPPLCFEG